MSNAYVHEGVHSPRAPLERWQRADFALPPGPTGLIFAVVVTIIVGRILVDIGWYGLAELYHAVVDDRPVKAVVAGGLIGVVIAALLKIKLFK